MPLDDLIHATAERLGGAEALAMLKADPYWPKWDGPWWQATLLWELGHAALIPEVTQATFVTALNEHYLPHFPLVEADIPPGADPYRHILCHCALGTMIQVLQAAGVDVAAALPRALPWILKHQLPDGGLNCDEQAYTRPEPRGSIVSTLPAAEALLWGPWEGPEVERALDAAAGYLLARRLNYSLSRGDEIAAEFWTPTFPRFYAYDVLRGLRFLAGWSKRRGRPLPQEATAEARGRLERFFESEDAPRRFHEGRQTLRQEEGGAWRHDQPALGSPLLAHVSAPSVARARLYREALGLGLTLKK